MGLFSSDDSYKHERRRIAAENARVRDATFKINRHFDFSPGGTYARKYDRLKKLTTDQERLSVRRGATEARRNLGFALANRGSLGGTVHRQGLHSISLDRGRGFLNALRIGAEAADRWRDDIERRRADALGMAASSDAVGSTLQSVFNRANQSIANATPTVGDRALQGLFNVGTVLNRGYQTGQGESQARRLAADYGFWGG